MNPRHFPVRSLIGAFVVFILAPYAIATDPSKEDSKYEAISRRVISRIVALKKTYPVLDSVGEPQITDGGLATLDFEHGVRWALEDPTKPHSKGNARYEIFDKDGFWIRLLFYRGRWEGAAMFIPVEFGDLKLWFTYGYRPGDDPAIIVAVSKIIHEEKQAFDATTTR